MGKEENLDEILFSIIQNITDVDIVYKIDSDGNFTFINNAVKQLGYEPNELIGKHYSILIHPDDHDNVSRSKVLPKYKGKKTGDKNSPKLFDERRTKARSTQNLEVRLLSKDKQVCVGEVTASGSYIPSPEDESKEFSGTIGVIRNITEKKRLEKQLRYVTRASSLKTMAAGIAHDFDNIIQVLTGFLDLMIMSDEIKTDNDHYKTVTGSLDLLGGLTKKLKSISAGDASKKTNVEAVIGLA